MADDVQGSDAMRRFGIVLFLLLCSAGHAEVFKCLDKANRISYSQQPCPQGSVRMAMEGASLSIVESSQQGAATRYRQELKQWSAQRDKQRTQDGKAEKLANERAQRKWQEEKAHCQRLADKRKALSDSMRIGMTPAQLQTAQSRLVKVEDQMQDRACHLYKDE
ncbi:DUF4124 domain-containing protein [Chromobacterium sp. IIBBL 290-4]|uniref:DUF4124 domain-containing protein n=1 Tax=Chromobacterium sp. IIBBL 290-4 TaxID=2953890 RepID=UPI0020B6A742|nr:DUF4124 domain-containing protein [Chromobacterium sp. IIBBL 290-4]UTH75132.1 DUF4124 domain-containing protein [Chromobacterium sp. IIBBL 290-4]